MRYPKTVLLFVSFACLWSCGDDDGQPPEPDAAVDAAPDAEVVSFDHPAKVLSIVDGDTIWVRYEGQELDIRFLCVNTPEVDMPYYTEAKTFTTTYAMPTTTVGLEFHPAGCAADPTAAECVGPFGRSLAYIRTSEDYDLGALLLANGLARVWQGATPDNCDRLTDYETLQAQAQSQGLGIWSQ